ncbi:DinB family protein [Rubrivirga sp.]|uniref:DinB family protein n=1 Tax=Rubrivirga sp. TaxID=1885344 RepID=UPI003C70AE02
MPPSPPPRDLEADARLRHELVALLQGGQASVDAATALEGVPLARVNDRLPGWDHSLWDLLEHLRVTQADILEFSTDAGYRDKRWPADYWPDLEAVEGDWGRALESFLSDLEALKDVARTGDLFAELGHAPGYTLLRELMLAAEHNAHHLGQLIALRRQLGIWPPRDV